MASLAYIDTIDLEGIPTRHNPFTVITWNEMLELWGNLPHSRSLDVGTILRFPSRDTAASPPNDFTSVYTSYLDAKMPIPASSFLVEFLRFTGITLSQLFPSSLDKVFAFEELSLLLGWAIPTMSLFLTFFGITRKDERVTISTRPGRRLLGGLKDRTHRWKDRYFFAAISALGLDGVPEY